MKTNILRLVTECLWQDVDSRDDVYLVYKFIYDLELKKMGVDKKELSVLDDILLNKRQLSLFNNL